MKLHNLKPADGSVKRTKRIGRGEGSGHGGTSTRGHKGAKSRSGYKAKAGFEGGQMPLQRRVPKFGFKSPNRIECKPINLDDIQKLVDNKGLSEITFEVLYQNGLVGKNDKVKLLARGEIKSAVSITLHACSATAKEAVEAKGGKVNVL